LTVGSTFFKNDKSTELMLADHSINFKPESILFDFDANILPLVLRPLQHLEDGINLFQLSSIMELYYEFRVLLK
jgi:hypothetical protein